MESVGNKGSAILSATWVAACLFLFSLQAAAALPKPEKIATAMTPEQRALIREGVVLHDEGKYAQAIAKYEEVLRLNPDCVEALQEKSMSQYAAHDLEGAAQTALQGAAYTSEFLGSFYAALGNIYDDLGQVDRAVETYEAGLALAPEDAMAHFNLAVTLYKRKKDVDGAKEHLRRAEALSPEHPSTCLMLGYIYLEQGMQVQSFLALAHFLLLEPASPRSADALAALREALQGGSKVSRQGKNVTISLNVSKTQDLRDGDFEDIAGPMALWGGIMAIAPSGSGKEEQQRDVEHWKLLLKDLSEEKYRTQPAVLSRLDAAFFGAVSEAGHAEACYYWTHQSDGEKATQKWLKKNRDKMEAFLSWAGQYKWPRLDVDELDLLAAEAESARTAGGGAKEPDGQSAGDGEPTGGKPEAAAPEPRAD